MTPYRQLEKHQQLKPPLIELHIFLRGRHAVVQNPSCATTKPLVQQQQPIIPRQSIPPHHVFYPARRRQQRRLHSPSPA
ncbi:hypothetical protein [Prochlorococcus sp. MIT 1342]|uniref:hypothetical protein n=1 Tax=Prochlorococcus sp. MIT 1342 TaxID=3082532 RepID=UPI0039B66B22